MVAISPTASTTAAMSQSTQASIERPRLLACHATVRQRAHSRGSTSARAKSSASNGRRSSSASPMPISLTGMPELAGDRQRDAALRGAVELRQHDAVDRHRLGEQLGLAQAVLAGRRVDRRAASRAARRAAAWRSRGGPSPARPSGRPGCAGARRCRRSPRRRRARGPCRTASKATAPGSEPSGPVTISQPARCAHSGELLDGGGAERVGGAEQRPSCRARSRRCQASLPIVVVLPVPLTPATMITVGSWRRSIAALARSGDVGEQLDAAAAVSASPPSTRAARRLLLELRDDLGGRARADVGHDQRLLQALPGLLVERARTASPGSRRRAPARVLDRFSRRRRKKPRGALGARARAATPARRAPSPVMKSSVQSRGIGGARR